MSSISVVSSRTEPAAGFGVGSATAGETMIVLLTLSQDRRGIRRAFGWAVTPAGCGEVMCPSQARSAFRADWAFSPDASKQTG